MTVIQNNANVIELGKAAAAKWADGQSAAGGGDALATEALYRAARTMTFKAEVNRGTKDEPEIEVTSFDLLDTRIEPRNNDGTADTKMKTARTIAIASTVFGLTELDNPTKTSLARALKMALYLAEKYNGDEDEKYFSRVSTRLVKTRMASKDKMTICLVVPEEAVFAAPAEDADDEVKARYEASRNLPRTLNGKDKASLAELGRRANPPKATGGNTGGRDEKGKEQTFVASLAFVRAIVQQNSNEQADESEVGLSEAIRRELFGLAQDIAAYFAIDPMEDEGENEQQESAAA